MDLKLHKAIELRAHAIWQDAGCPEGADLLHWMQAERELGVFGQVDEGQSAERVDLETLQREEAARASAEEPLE